MSEFDVKSLIFPDFASAASAVLTMLYDRLGFRLWMVTKTQGDDWIVLQVKDQGYGVKKGDVFRWTDSFCSRMVEGLGPRIAPSSKDVIAYATAPIGNQVPISAYVGVPLVRSDGTLFGTLCAIDPSEQSQSITYDLAFVELQAKLLSTLLDMESKASVQIRETQRAECDELIDPLTQLYDAKGWDKFLTYEENRCFLYGTPTGIVSIRLQNLADSSDNLDLISKTSQILKNTLRKEDFIAYLGGDRFAVLAVESDRFATQVITERLSKAFKEAEIQAFLGIAIREPSTTLEETHKKAEAYLNISSS